LTMLMLLQRDGHIIPEAVAIPRDQQKLLDHNDAWIPPNVGTAFPSCRVPEHIRLAFVPNPEPALQPTPGTILDAAIDQQAVESPTSLANNEELELPQREVDIVQAVGTELNKSPTALSWKASSPIRPSPDRPLPQKRGTKQLSLPPDSSPSQAPTTQQTGRWAPQNQISNLLESEEGSHCRSPPKKKHKPASSPHALGLSVEDLVKEAMSGSWRKKNTISRTHQALGLSQIPDSMSTQMPNIAMAESVPSRQVQSFHADADSDMSSQLDLEVPRALGEYYLPSGASTEVAADVIQKQPHHFVSSRESSAIDSGPSTEQNELPSSPPESVISTRDDLLASYAESQYKSSSATLKPPSANQQRNPPSSPAIFSSLDPAKIKSSQPMSSQSHLSLAEEPSISSAQHHLRHMEDSFETAPSYISRDQAHSQQRPTKSFTIFPPLINQQSSISRDAATESELVFTLEKPLPKAQTSLNRRNDGDDNDEYTTPLEAFYTNYQSLKSRRKEVQTCESILYGNSKELQPGVFDILAWQL
jgi:hypothetical protein